MRAATSAEASALRRLGDRIVRRRMLRGKTQEAIAEKAGISVQFLRRVERGTGNPSFLTLLKIAKALETSITELSTADE